MVVTDGLNKALQMHNNSMIIDRFPRRMEKVTDLSFSSPGAFSNTFNYYLNPGNSLLFPIFSQIAAVYEQFRCRFLRFHYVSEEYTASGTAVSAGKVIMATNADPDDPPFNAATPMENYIGSDRTAPFSSMTHDALSPLSKVKNRRGGAYMPLNEYFVNSSGNTPAPIDQPAKFYDMGLFQLAASGMPFAAANLEIGELYVEYEFDLIRPRELARIGANLNASHVTEYPYGTASATNPVGTSNTGTIKTGSNIQINTSISGSTQRFWWANPGNFMVLFSATGTGADCVLASYDTSHTQILSNMWKDNTVSVTGAFQGGNTTSILAALVVCDGSPSGGITYSIPIQSAGTLDFWVIQVPASISNVVRLKDDDMATLKTQVSELGKMFKALLVKVPDDDDTPVVVHKSRDDDVKTFSPRLPSSHTTLTQPIQSPGSKSAWF